MGIEDDFLIEGNPPRLGRLPFVTDSELNQPQPQQKGKVICRHCGWEIPVLSASFMAKHMNEKHRKKANNVIHSDAELGQKMAPAKQAPEAGPSNTELVENSHSENGASPVLDGELKSPERANVNAIREAIDTQAEMEVGKPINEKAQEVAQGGEEGKAMEIDAKPGKQIIINIAGKKGAVTSGISDIDGVAPNFEVNFTLKGKERKAAFTTYRTAEEFIRVAQQKFGSKIAFFPLRAPVQKYPEKGVLPMGTSDKSKKHFFNEPESTSKAVQCMDCNHVGIPDRQGGCEKCRSKAVTPQILIDDAVMPQNYEIEASAKEAMLPEKGSKEWKQVRVALDALQTEEPMGMTKEQAMQILRKYNIQYKMSKESTEALGETKDNHMANIVTKEAGINFFFPGQVLKEFYPEMQHEIVDYPNANNSPMGQHAPEMVGDGGHDMEAILDDVLDNHSIVEAIQLPGDVGDLETMSMAAADYSSTSPAGGMGIGRDGKPQVQEGVPLRKENDIRGPMFTDEFYGQYEGVPGAMLSLASKTAANEDEASQFADFLKKVCGEIAATLIAAFKVTSRPLLDKVPGVGEVQLASIEQPAGVTFNNVNAGSRVKYLLDKLNDSEIQKAINDAWSQAAVWNDGPTGGFIYEVFVRAETIDTDSMILKYKFVAGTRERE